MGTQLPLEFKTTSSSQNNCHLYSYKDRLLNSLSGDLDFHYPHIRNSLHNFHSFPAQFPPQLPYTFIKELTDPQDFVLDPMAGSGTTVLEAFMLGRRGIGFDIDPLALLIIKVKTSHLDVTEVIKTGNRITNSARTMAKKHGKELVENTKNDWDQKKKNL